MVNKRGGSKTRRRGLSKFIHEQRTGPAKEDEEADPYGTSDHRRQRRAARIGSPAMSKQAKAEVADFISEEQYERVHDRANETAPRKVCTRSLGNRPRMCSAPAFWRLHCAACNSSPATATHRTRPTMLRATRERPHETFICLPSAGRAVARWMPGPAVRAHPHLQPHRAAACNAAVRPCPQVRAVRTARCL